MAPTYRRLLTQTSSLSRSSGGSALGGSVVVSPVTENGPLTGGMEIPLQSSSLTEMAATPGVAAAPLDSAATVVSTSTQSHISISGHQHNAPTPMTTLAPGNFINPASAAVAATAVAAKSLQQAKAANAVIAAAHVQHRAAPPTSQHLNFLRNTHATAKPIQPAPSPQVAIPAGAPSSLGCASANPSSNIFNGVQKRRGKWTQEEERYAHRLIKEFENGTLTDCENGATLRSYLSRKLHCAPMRISKKFAGKSIGKHVFLSRSTDTRMNNLPSYNLHDSANEPPLRDLELRFYHSLVNENNGGDSKTQTRPTLVPPNGFQNVALPSSHGHFVPQMQFPHEQMFHVPVPQIGATSQPATMQAQAPRAAATSSQPPVQQSHPGAPASEIQAQFGAVMVPPAASSPPESEHDKQLRESFLSALKQASSQLVSSEQSQQTAPSKPASHGGNMGDSKPSSTLSTSAQSEPEAKAPSAELPEFLSGFEKMASAVSAHMPMWPNEALAGSSLGQLPPTPTFTSTSFDELHRCLGNGLPSQQSFQLNQSHYGLNDDKATSGPATEALRMQENQTTATDNTNITQDGASSGEPEQPSAQSKVISIIPQPNKFCSDAYAMFAQQSALAVSQHSAYCRTEESKNIADQVASVKRSRASPVQVAVVEDVHDPMIKAKASNSKACVASEQDQDTNSSSSDLSERPLSKRARIVAAPPTTFTSSTLGRHVSIISGSERSESESAVGSSRGSSSGSASDEADDNASDNASDQSESVADTSSAHAEQNVKSPAVMKSASKDMGYRFPSSDGQ